MSANQADFPIMVMASVLGMSKAGYCAWASRVPSARAMADAVLLKSGSAPSTSTRTRPMARRASTPTYVSRASGILTNVSLG